MSLKNVFLCCKYDFLSAFTGRFCFMLSDVEKIAFNVFLSLYVSGFHYFRFWVQFRHSNSVRGCPRLPELARACPSLPEAQEGSGSLGQARAGLVRPPELARACLSLPEPARAFPSLGQAQAASDRVTVPKLNPKSEIMKP